MAIYKFQPDKLLALPETTFSSESIKERDDLQRLLRDQIEIISPDTLVIAEEFGEFEGVRRRIDLLGLDKQANLVVIELKRTEDGGHMELQAIRYAAMVSAMTFDGAVDIYTKYLRDRNIGRDAKVALLEFLDWDEPTDEDFGQDVRIVLASAEFSKELTASVLWLNERNLDITCYRLKPYKLDDQVFLDVQKIIPLPETAEFQVQLREKKIIERMQKSEGRDLTKYNIHLGDKILPALPKRKAIFYVIKHLCDSGITPNQIQTVVNWRGSSLWRSADGTLDSDQFETAVSAASLTDGPAFNPRRWFRDDDQLIRCDGKTYALTKMWGERTAEAMASLLQQYPDTGISFSVAE